MTARVSHPTYIVDPDDPRAPPQDVWDRLTPEERRAVVAALPSEFPLDQAAPPEGDWHSKPVVRIERTLDRFFRGRGRGVYVGMNLPVYYPGSAMFSPDVFAVMDTDPHPRQGWAVSDEGRRLDIAIEVVVAGRRRKDLIENVSRYAQLGIPEYFVFEPRSGRLSGYALAEKSSRVYTQLAAGEDGRLASNILGLSISVERDNLRFWAAANAAVLSDDELIARLEKVCAERGEAREHEALAREQEALTREREALAREQRAEARLAEMIRENEELKKRFER